MPKKKESHYEVLMPEQKKVWQDLKAATDLNYTLYGGMAVALRFGHRQSIDFDFFSSEPQNAKKLIASMPILETAKVSQKESDTLTFKIPVDGKEVKISFFNDMDMGRVGTPEFTSDGVVRLASPEDLLATKFRALLDRSEAKDYKDIAEMCRAGHSIKAGLGAAATMYAPLFSPALGAKALNFFGDGDLNTLSQKDKDILIETVKSLDLNTIHKMPILSKDLAGDGVKDIALSQQEGQEKQQGKASTVANDPSAARQAYEPARKAAEQKVVAIIDRLQARAQQRFTVAKKELKRVSQNRPGTIKELLTNGKASANWKDDVKKVVIALERAEMNIDALEKSITKNRGQWIMNRARKIDPEATREYTASLTSPRKEQTQNRQRTKENKRSSPGISR